MTTHTTCIVTFQKENGNIIMRPRLNAIGLKIGDTTSMGWEVLDIHYQSSDGNYYHEEDLRRLKRKSRETIKQKIAKYLMRKLNAWR